MCADSACCKSCGDVVVFLQGCEVPVFLPLDFAFAGSDAVEKADSVKLVVASLL